MFGKVSKMRELDFDRRIRRRRVSSLVIAPSFGAEPLENVNFPALSLVGRRAARSVPYRAKPLRQASRKSWLSLNVARGQKRP